MQIRLVETLCKIDVEARIAIDVVGSAFAKAVQPFLVWDALKMLFAALTVTGIWALAKKRT